MLQPLQASSLANLANIRHGFFTRAGGRSHGIFATLNCGFGSSDDKAAVVANRRFISDHLGGRFGGIVTLYQEHGTTALSVDRPPSQDALPRADAVVTRESGLVIGVLTADCAPVLLADADAGVVAAAHAGWRGAVNGVLESVVAEMERNGARRQRVRAAIGPCISQAAYEVGPEYQAAVTATDPSAAVFFRVPTGGAKAHFDLPGYVAKRLSAIGLNSIERQTLCTHENESQFFSYRRTTQRKEPDYGRQISAIVVA